jgi:cbb3-type cytochrome oxidase subunit 3
MSIFMGLSTVAAFLAFVAVIAYAVFASRESIDAAARAPLEEDRT